METLTISYSQLFIANADIEIPAIDWTEQDLQRGYVIFQGGVVFEALSNYLCEISVIEGSFKQKQGTLRNITVPFEVLEGKIVIFSVISEHVQFILHPGLYNVSLQALPLQEPTSDGLYTIRYELHFTPTEFEHKE